MAADSVRFASVGPDLQINCAQCGRVPLPRRSGGKQGLDFFCCGHALVFCGCWALPAGSCLRMFRGAPNLRVCMRKGPKSCAS